MDYNKIINDIKVNLSKNGVIVSNLVTYSLLFKNLPAHYRLVRKFKNKNEINSPYIKLKKLISDHPELNYKDAIVQDKQNITYAEMITQIENFSNYLENELGHKKGDKLSICAESSIEGIISFFAMNSLGLVNARIFNGSKKEKLKANILNFESSTILIDENNLDELSDIATETNIKNVLLISKCSEEKINSFKSKNPDIEIINWFEIQEIGKKCPEHSNVEVRENDSASILYTSGSSGEPKPILFPNRSYTNMIDIVKQTTNEHVADDEKVVGVVSHEYPYAANNSTTMILLLGKTLVLPKHEEKLNFNNLLSNGVNKIQAIPSFIKLLVNEIKSKDLSIADKKDLIEKLSYLDFMVSGGEPYQLSEKKDFLRIMMELGYAPLLIDGFGFGEMGSAAALKFGLSEYFLLMNGIEATVIDPKTREILPKGQEGLLCFAGPTITQGYYNNSEATKKSFVYDETGKEWFITDTFGSVNGPMNRLIHLGGRLRECFITSDGHGNFVKVYSGNVEDVILSSNFVSDCIVVPSDNSAAPSPVAYISLKNDCNLSREDILKIIKEKCMSLENFSQPTCINIEDDIKRTTAEKKDYNYYREIQQTGHIK